MGLWNEMWKVHVGLLQKTIKVTFYDYNDIRVWRRGRDRDDMESTRTSQ